MWPRIKLHNKEADLEEYQNKVEHKYLEIDQTQWSLKSKEMPKNQDKESNKFKLRKLMIDLQG